MLSVFCNQPQNKISFDYIDFSYSNGWSNYYSIKILPAGESFIMNDKLNNNKIYLAFKFDEKALDSLTKLVRKIYYLNLDTVYDKNCDDCQMYSIIIKYKDKKFRLFVNGIDDSNESINFVNNLIHYVMNITGNYNDSLNAIFKFESKTEQFSTLTIPPP